LNGADGARCFAEIRESTELSRARNLRTMQRRSAFPASSIFARALATARQIGQVDSNCFIFKFIAVSGTPQISPLQIGDRVKLSTLGQERSPRMTRTGVIVGAIGSSFEVLMDGGKIPVRLHRSYLEKADV
jgi:hypothetical protein